VAKQQQTAQLFREVEVASDEYLADVAGNLTLAEMVEMLDAGPTTWSTYGTSGVESGPPARGVLTDRAVARRSAGRPRHVARVGRTA
jgi:hypothetical protein